MKWRTFDNKGQIMKETDGESKEKEGESNYMWLQEAKWPNGQNSDLPHMHFQFLLVIVQLFSKHG